MRLKRIAAMFAGTLFGISMFTVPVLANTGKESECICEDHCNEDEVNSDCTVCTKDISLCQGKEKAEKDASLTPDGNMTLVDDLGKHKSAGKQFLTITSKSGKFFYIIIDRDDSGNETVHFLNQVDEADLLDLMNDEDIETYQKAKEASEEPAVLIPETTPEPKEIEETEVKVTEEKKSKTPYAVGLVIVCGLLGAGGIALFLMNHKKKKAADNYVDPDADYDEKEDIDLPEEEDESVTFAEDNDSDSEKTDNE